YDAALARARLVLAAMAEQGVITQDEATKAGREIKLHSGRQDLPIGSYFADWIQPQTNLAFNRAYGEVTVRTTIDSALQAQAEKSLSQVLAASGDRLHATQGALVAVRTDGSVVAMVGGRDYAKSQFNRAAQAMRQPGSSFKPFVYLAAMRAGMTPDSLVLDAPIKIGDWAPENHESHYANAPITLRQAFAKSSNVAAVRLAQQIGVAPIQRAARELGITEPLPDNLTIALGSATLPLIQMTSAYAGIAGGSAPVTPYGLAARPSPPPARPLGHTERQDLLQLMRAVVTDGTGQAANIGSAPAFGKTGTSQDYRDAYFIGFVGDLVIGVWVGNDDNTPMKRVVGGMLPAQIWREVMSYAVAHGKVKVAPLLDAPLPAPVYEAEPTPPGFEEPELAPAEPALGEDRRVNLSPSPSVPERRGPIVITRPAAPIRSQRPPEEDGVPTEPPQIPAVQP
ncbi:MAG TPA: penicillin-binding transpeptidase domain-containing protein, partial [Caulobacteraceae bacterium]|nr:penicillin-binding transpeptidase domain-containing protein [Caulobacteraceae bacterium]